MRTAVSNWIPNNGCIMEVVGMQNLVLLRGQRAGYVLDDGDIHRALVVDLFLSMERNAYINI
jgi:hypothetical protein